MTLFAVYGSVQWLNTVYLSTSFLIHSFVSYASFSHILRCGYSRLRLFAMDVFLSTKRCILIQMYANATLIDINTLFSNKCSKWYSHGFLNLVHRHRILKKKTSNGDTGDAGQLRNFRGNDHSSTNLANRSCFLLLSPFSSYYIISTIQLFVFCKIYVHTFYAGLHFHCDT